MVVAGDLGGPFPGTRLAWVGDLWRGESGEGVLCDPLPVKVVEDCCVSASGEGEVGADVLFEVGGVKFGKVVEVGPSILEGRWCLPLEGDVGGFVCCCGVVGCGVVVVAGCCGWVRGGGRKGGRGSCRG